MAATGALSKNGGHAPAPARPCRLHPHRALGDDRGAVQFPAHGLPLLRHPAPARRASGRRRRGAGVLERGALRSRQAQPDGQGRRAARGHRRLLPGRGHHHQRCRHGALRLCIRGAGQQRLRRRPLSRQPVGMERCDPARRQPRRRHLAVGPQAGGHRAQAHRPHRVRRQGHDSPGGPAGPAGLQAQPQRRPARSRPALRVQQRHRRLPDYDKRRCAD